MESIKYTVEPAFHSRVVKTDLKTLQSTSLDSTLGHSLVVENWYLNQDIHTDAASMVSDQRGQNFPTIWFLTRYSKLSDINSKGDEIPRASPIEFRITYADSDATNLVRVETGPAAVRNHAPVVSPTKSHKMPMPTGSTPYTHGPSVDSVLNDQLVNSTIRLDSTTTRPSGLRNLAIPINGIAVEGSNPIDITGHFSDLFVGVYRNDRVALKRLRIDRYPSHRGSREIKVSIPCILQFEVFG